MRSRRALVFVLAGLVIALGAFSAAQRDDARRATTPATSKAAAGAPAAAQGDIVQGVLPADKVVRAQVGDLVELRVSSEVPDVAKIDGLGVQGAVGPNLAGELSFQAGEPGRFPVTLMVAGRPAGVVVVRAPAG